MGNAAIELALASILFGVALCYAIVVTLVPEDSHASA
jgi:hypothetical protein